MKSVKTTLPVNLHSAFAKLLHRPRVSHKYDFGRVLVIGGSKSMVGAPVLAGKAALRAGAGVVELCVPDSIAAIAAGFDPCLITHGLASDADGCFDVQCLPELLALAARADVLVCGPGMGRSGSLPSLVQTLWQQFPRTAVFDADALFALSQLDLPSLQNHAGARILTPHAAELARFFPVQKWQRPALELACIDLSARINAVIILKGSQSHITNGLESIHNQTGNPGMASAGSGDVLSGVVAALSAQGLSEFHAAQCAAWLHGMAGDLAVEVLTEPALTALDILDYLPTAWQYAEHLLDGSPN